MPVQPGVQVAGIVAQEDAEIAGVPDSGGVHVEGVEAILEIAKVGNGGRVGDREMRAAVLRNRPQHWESASRIALRRSRGNPASASRSRMSHKRAPASPDARRRNPIRS